MIILIAEVYFVDFWKFCFLNILIKWCDLCYQIWGKNEIRKDMEELNLPQKPLTGILYLLTV